MLLCVSRSLWNGRFSFWARKFTPEVKSLPNAKVLSEKQAIVEALSQRVKGATCGVIVNYEGINVADDTQLRRELTAAGRTTWITVL